MDLAATFGLPGALPKGARGRRSSGAVEHRRPRQRGRAHPSEGVMSEGSCSGARSGSGRGAAGGASRGGAAAARGRRAAPGF